MHGGQARERLARKRNHVLLTFLLVSIRQSLMGMTRMLRSPHGGLFQAGYFFPIRNYVSSLYKKTKIKLCHYWLNKLFIDVHANCAYLNNDKEMKLHFFKCWIWGTFNFSIDLTLYRAEIWNHCVEIWSMWFSKLKTSLIHNNSSTGPSA